MVDKIWNEYNKKLKESYKTERIIDRIKRRYKENPIAFCILVVSWCLSVMCAVCQILHMQKLSDITMKIGWMGWAIYFVIEHITYKECKLQSRLEFEKEKQKALKSALKGMGYVTKEQYDKWSDILSKQMEKRGTVVEIIDMFGKFCGVVIIPLMISDVESSNMTKALTLSVWGFALWLIFAPFKDLLDNHTKYRELRETLDYIIVNLE